jgi:hypothetical protein
MNSKLLLFIILIFTFSLNSNAQSRHRRYKDSLVLEKWKRAIVNIEARPFHLSSDSIQPYILNYWKRDDKKAAEIIAGFYAKLLTELISYSGTATYLYYNDKHYLITARHVIYDIEKSKKLKTDAVNSQITLIENSTNKYGDSIKSSAPSVSLTNSSVPFEIIPYALSSKENDVAVIDLDDAYDGKLFVEGLKKRGYIPITISDIETKPPAKEKRILVLGFPQFSMRLDPHFQVALLMFVSPYVSTPTSAKGYFENHTGNKNFIYASVIVDHGMSGEPILYRNKQIGITSAFGRDSTVTKDHDGNFGYHYAYHSYFAKSALIIPLLKELEERFRKKPAIKK